MNPINPIRQVRICGAGPGPNLDAYWVHDMTVEVNNKVGDLFKPVFDQYNYVYISSVNVIPYNDGVPEYELYRDSHLQSVMLNLQMNMSEVIIEIYAKNKNAGVTIKKTSWKHPSKDIKKNSFFQPLDLSLTAHGEKNISKFSVCMLKAVSACCES
jgi:hypothetical protein